MADTTDVIDADEMQPISFHQSFDGATVDVDTLPAQSGTAGKHTAWTAKLLAYVCPHPSG